MLFEAKDLLEYAITSSEFELYYTTTLKSLVSVIPVYEELRMTVTLQQTIQKMKKMVNSRVQDISDSYLLQYVLLLIGKYNQIT